MDLFQSIDGYCERVGPSFWAEPVNALTNLAFLAAAALVWRRARQDPPFDPAVGLLLVLVVAIGIGSFLFHTFATGWAALADVLPITLFILAYLALALRRFAAVPWWASLVAVPAFLVLSAGLERVVRPLVPPDVASSVGYLPALLALATVGAFLELARRHPAGRWLLAGAWLFAVSLTFRSLDLPLCGTLPFGTHFVWHVLNGVLLGLLVLALVRHGRPDREDGDGRRP